MGTKVAANVKVNFLPTVSTDPSDVQVSKKDNNGIVWTAQQGGYTFTGVTITDDTAEGGEWAEPVISTTTIPGPLNPAEPMTVSQMTVADKFKDKTDHKYTLAYTDPMGVAHTYDPGIKNND